jgi:hypothetical protein
MEEIYIPAPKLPTEEEMRSVSERWWASHFGVNFLDWNEVLLSHTLPLETCKIPVWLIDATLELIDGKGDISKVAAACEPLLSNPLKKLQCEESFFLKLITRSPKDVLETFEFTNIREAVSAIAFSSRTFEDLCLLRHIDMGYFVVRPFTHIEPWQEWRVLVENKSIVGISQYHYDKCFAFTVSKIQEIEAEIRDFINTIVIQNMKVDCFCADVIISDGESPTILLETNPYGLSDPCLFENYKSLDGSFKYVKPENQ